ncbi:MAG: deoxyguanosinetriphosphate triphosphohydrolase [Clostridiales bacterium]|jgi:dGTPase|nr:deoxyguanosinetriphosphate triphosphohydrolase [Clostridiales bacterium]
MIIREEIERREQEYLSPYAALSAYSKGRQYPQEKCSIRTEFQRDRDRILHSKSFRRLKHKTQVFIAPEGDHYRTRLTHTLEVSQISRTIARALKLNEDLTEAIALGHDLGHTPFGHMGERTLNKVSQNGFRHNLQSLRVVEDLEDGRGLNLTWEVRDGIKNHTESEEPSTLEGRIVRISDRIAYINHDIDDAIRAKIISQESLPGACIEVLGETHGQRINNMVEDVIFNSLNKAYIRMSDKVKNATYELRKFMFEKVYVGTISRNQENEADSIIKGLFYYFSNNPKMLPPEYYKSVSRCGIDQVVCDYIAGMTDRYALGVFKSIQNH